MKNKYKLDTIDHIAIQVENIEKSVEWYKNKFKCKIIYSDKTWAFIQFKNKCQMTPFEIFVQNECFTRPN